MALLIAFNATAINADERAREHATMFAYGVTVGRVVRGGVVEALLIGALGTAVGIAAGHALLSWIVNLNMPETMPDVGMLISVAPPTYALALLAGTVVVAAAPLLTAAQAATHRHPRDAAGRRMTRVGPATAPPVAPDDFRVGAQSARVAVASRPHIDR